MKIGLVYAMTGEIESLLTQENAQPLQTVAGVPFYQIRPDVIACAGGVSKVNAAMATQLLISRTWCSTPVWPGALRICPLVPSFWRRAFCSTTWTPRPWATLWDWCPR